MSMMSLPTVFILAGGMGTRLGTLSDKLPKSLIEFDGKPFLEYQLAFLEQQGVENVVLCLGRHGDAVLRWLENGYSGTLNVSCSFDGSKLLGTGGALRQALQKDIKNSFAVMYGDTLLDFKISEVVQAFNSSNCSALMTTYKNNGSLDKSNIIHIGEESIIYDKSGSLRLCMDCIDYGFVVINRDQFLTYCETLIEFDLAEFLETESSKQKLNGFKVTNRFFEIGSFSGIADFKKRVSQF